MTARPDHTLHGAQEKSYTKEPRRSGGAMDAASAPPENREDEEDFAHAFTPTLLRRACLSRLAVGDCAATRARRESARAVEHGRRRGGGARTVARRRSLRGESKRRRAVRLGLALSSRRRAGR